MRPTLTLAQDAAIRAGKMTREQALSLAAGDMDPSEPGVKIGSIVEFLSGIKSNPAARKAGVKYGDHAKVVANKDIGGGASGNYYDLEVIDGKGKGTKLTGVHVNEFTASGVSMSHKLVLARDPAVDELDILFMVDVSLRELEKLQNAVRSTKGKKGKALLSALTKVRDTAQGMADALDEDLSSFI